MTEIKLINKFINLNLIIYQHFLKKNSNIFSNSFDFSYFPFKFSKKNLIIGLSFLDMNIRTLNLNYSISDNLYNQIHNLSPAFSLIYSYLINTVNTYKILRKYSASKLALNTFLVYSSLCKFRYL